MQPTTCARAGAICAGVAVALGAFAAHAMQGRFDSAALATFETAVRYQTYHALALLGCSALAAHGGRTVGAARCFLAGIVLFSGSLYAMVLLGARWLGPVTPIGGIAFLAGWVLLALGRRRPAPSVAAARTR